jgi:hypothetical protein
LDFHACRRIALRASAVSIPYSLTFTFDAFGFYAWYAPLCDAVFMTDLCLSFNTAVELEQGGILVHR